VSQRLKTILSGNQVLQSLLSNAQILSALQSHFTAIAPPALTQSVQILSLRLGTLSVAVANAAIAAKLRQLAPELVVLMQNRGCEVSGIRIKVQVSFDRLQPKPAPHKLSKSAKIAMKELSQNLDDSSLKRALERLSQKN
jgi:hypothetical protein